jgi:hypothetical protein
VPEVNDRAHDRRVCGLGNLNDQPLGGEVQGESRLYAAWTTAKCAAEVRTPLCLLVF